MEYVPQPFRVIRHPEDQHCRHWSPKVQTTSPTTVRFQRIPPRWSAVWAPALRESWLVHCCLGNCAIQGSDTPTKRLQRASHGAPPAGEPGRGAGGWRQGQGGPRDRPLRAQLACGDLAGGPPPTGTHSGQALRAGQDAWAAAHGAAQPSRHPGTPKGRVPKYPPLTQPLPRRGSGRMILSPGDGDASTGTCRPRRPLPGQHRRSGRRSRCGRGPSSAWWPGRRARRNRSSRR